MLVLCEREKPSNEEPERFVSDLLGHFASEEMLFREDHATSQSFSRPYKSLSYFDCFQPFLAMDGG